MLPHSAQHDFENDGFFVLPGFVASDVCAGLRARAHKMLEEFDPDRVRSVFSSREQGRTADDYFLGSGDKIRFFFEEAAFDSHGELVQDKRLCINKIGHALHRLDPVFRGFSARPEITAVINALGPDNPLQLQSMYLCKQPRIGGEVVLHQDASFLYTDPLSVMGLWLALEDATQENGCLWALPGAHRAGLKKRFRRAADGGTVFEPLDTKPFPDIAPVPLEVSTGTLVVLHGLLPHYSSENHSDKSRHAYALHVIDADAEYPDDNWLQRSDVNTE